VEPGPRRHRARRRVRPARERPGIKPDEVKIEVEDNVLTVSGEHEEREEERDNFLRRERRYGSFARAISLPQGVTHDEIEATVQDGVVEISIPKPREEERKAVTITPKEA
jgi:HSP20 family protein